MIASKIKYPGICESSGRPYYLVVAADARCRHLLHDGALGCRVWLYRCGPFFRRTGCLPSGSWILRGSFLPWCCLPLIYFLREEEDGLPYRHAVLRIPDRSELFSVPYVIMLTVGQNAFGGLFALAILELEGAHGLEGWRWLFIVEGILTVGLGIIFACFIPNTPRHIRWLDEREKAQLLFRLEQDRASKDATDELGVMSAFKMAVTDPKTWLMCAILQCNYIAASITNFFPIVVAGLGFKRTTTLAITAPPYLLCVVAILINGWHSDKKQERTMHIVLPFCITIIGNVIAIATTNVSQPYSILR